MSFDIVLSGINAINEELSTISNNIANSGTYGFKSSRTNFSSMYAGTQPMGVEAGTPDQSIDKSGSLHSTGRSLDAAVQGRGFFVTKDTTGAMLYTRVGIFSVDKNGYVVDSVGRLAQGYTATNGVPVAAASGAPGDLKVPTGQIPAMASSKIDYVGNLSADWTVPTVAPFNATDPQSFNSSMVSVVYDSLGAKHSLTQYFVKTGTNAVDVHYSFDGTAVPTTTALSFTAAGQLAAVPAAALTLTPTNGAGALTVNLNYAGTTQFDGEAVTSTNNADGYASGVLTGVQLDGDGSVLAQYSNGQKQIIGTLAIATFPNEGGLSPASDTSWTTTKDSGEPLFFTPGMGVAGTLATGALEQSNVDVAAELVGLMTSQRNYQANTKVISTESQMMQALMQAV